jgi:hypothetical protein
VFFGCCHRRRRYGFGAGRVETVDVAPIINTPGAIAKKHADWRIRNRHHQYNALAVSSRYGLRRYDDLGAVAGSPPTRPPEDQKGRPTQTRGRSPSSAADGGPPEYLVPPAARDFATDVPTSERPKGVPPSMHSSALTRAMACWDYAELGGRGA